MQHRKSYEIDGALWALTDMLSCWFIFSLIFLSSILSFVYSTPIILLSFPFLRSSQEIKPAYCFCCILRCSLFTISLHPDKGLKELDQPGAIFVTEELSKKSIHAALASNTLYSLHHTQITSSRRCCNTRMQSRLGDVALESIQLLLMNNIFLR